MQVFKAALKEAGRVFLLSRLVIIFVTYITVSLLPQFVAFQGHTTFFPACTQGVRPDPCLLAWLHWDAGGFAFIAYQGYAHTSDVAFFPLWPLIIHIVAPLLGGSYPLSYYLAGVLLSNLFFFAALVLFYCLLAEDFEASLARRALFYIAFYPYALFFFLGYTESLFLLLTLGTFLLLRRGKMLDWWLAGGLGFLATLTRSSGLLLAVPFLVLYAQRFWLPGNRKPAEQGEQTEQAGSPELPEKSGKPTQPGFLQKVGALLPIGLIPAALLVYMFYLWQTKGNPLIFQVEEATNWDRHFQFFIIPLLAALKTVLTVSAFSFVTILNLLDIVFIALCITALVRGWRRLPLHYSAFALVTMLFFLSFPITGFNPFASQPRYLIQAFPIFIVFALWGKHAGFDRAYMAIAPALLALFTVLFVVHFWVA